MNSRKNAPRGESLRIALLEPFFGGSHKSFAEGWRRHSRHEITPVGLPPRFWKWRMRAGAFEMVRRVRELDFLPDLYVAGSLMDVAHFRALAGDRNAPLACYFHEAQAAYPWPGGDGPGERDYQYLLTDLASAAASDAVAFNSHHLSEEFFQRTLKFLQRMPDLSPAWVLDEIRAKSAVLPLGVDVAAIDAARQRGEGGVKGPPTVLWCHRWEYDKNPEAFFRALFTLADEGILFRVLVAGGTFSKVPEIFALARERLGERIAHWGEVKDRDAYAALLLAADVVVSTAFHETFGLGMVEAAYAGAHPLAPRRLAYPEVFPEECREACLYDTDEELTARLRELLSPTAARSRQRWTELFGKYAWERRVEDFDNFAASIHAGKNL